MLDALQHVDGTLEVLAGSWGTAVTPQDGQGVGGAWLALFPDCEQQRFAPTTQHQLRLVAAAADLLREEEPASQGKGALGRTSGQETEGP